eukprot:EG_transcript_16241
MPCHLPRGVGNVIEGVLEVESNLLGRLLPADHLRVLVGVERRVQHLQVDPATGCRVQLRKRLLDESTAPFSDGRLFSVICSPPASHIVVASSCCTASLLLHQAVGRIGRMQLSETSIRVPLDVARTNMRSLQWRPLSLTEQVVSANLDLLLVLQTARSLQHLTRRQTPLLVDENIHYRCLRLLYSASASRYYVSRYLAEVPLLYGIWHAYKHTVTIVYRAFFPVLAHLEVSPGDHHL